MNLVDIPRRRYISDHSDCMLMSITLSCEMDVFLVLLGAFWFPANLGLNINPLSNITNSTHDMYVIHATVYQVGIITNKSDDEIANMTGNQEALSFYHSNGSTADLSGIPIPIVTKVTAQSAVAVAPVQPGANTPALAAVLDQITPRENSPTIKRSGKSFVPLNEENFRDDVHNGKDSVFFNLFKRSASNSSEGPTIKVVKETSLIPPEVGLRSIGLPELIGLNTSIASVPLPIPNTSVVRYAKISTLVKAP